MITGKKYFNSWERPDTRARACNAGGKMYSINFTENNKRFCLSLHYNDANSYLFANGKEIYKFTTKYSEIVATPLCLGNISKDWSVDNMKKTGLNRYVYDLVLIMMLLQLLIY